MKENEKYVQEYEEKLKRQEEFSQIYHGEIGMCGCGRPYELQKFIFDLLKNHKDERDGIISSDLMNESRKKIITEADPDLIFEFIFHVMNKHGILEEGFSVYSSRFTEKGNRFYELLKEERGES